MKKLKIVRRKQKSRERVYTPADLMSDPLGDDSGGQSHWWYYENEVVFNVNKERQWPEKRSIKPISELEAGTWGEEEGES